MLLQLLNARAKVFRPQWEISFRTNPVASLSLSRRRKAAGFCVFDLIRGPSETVFLCEISAFSAPRR